MLETNKLDESLPLAFDGMVVRFMGAICDVVTLPPCFSTEGVITCFWTVQAKKFW